MVLKDGAIIYVSFFDVYRVYSWHDIISFHRPVTRLDTLCCRSCSCCFLRPSVSPKLLVAHLVDLTDVISPSWILTSLMFTLSFVAFPVSVCVCVRVLVCQDLNNLSTTLEQGSPQNSLWVVCCQIFALIGAHFIPTRSMFAINQRLHHVKCALFASYWFSIVHVAKQFKPRNEHALVTFGVGGTCLNTFFMCFRCLAFLSRKSRPHP